MNYLKSLCMICLAASTISEPSKANADDSALSFINQAGSTMQITIGNDGSISGTYRSALGCAKDRDAPLIGWTNGTAITFSVNFGECASITSWVGNFTPQGEISTIWTLTRDNEIAWTSMTTGASHFRKQDK